MGLENFGTDYQGNDRPMWIFADRFTPADEASDFTIVDGGMHTANGKEIPYLVMQGTYDNVNGKFRVSKWGLRFTPEFIKRNGAEPKNWLNARCKLKRNGTRLNVLPAGAVEEVVK